MEIYLYFIAKQNLKNNRTKLILVTLIVATPIRKRKVILKDKN